MRTRIRPGLLAAFALSAPGCWHSAPTPPASPAAATLNDEIPPANLAAFVKAHQEGVGYMERYDYPNASKAFRRAHELAPGLYASSINLAIAILNDTGTESEKTRGSGG